MLRDIKRPSKNGIISSTGIGLAYRFALQNQTKRQYQQHTGLLIALVGTLSAFIGVFALCYGWYFLGFLSSFCAGCATHGVYILSKRLVPASKIIHNQSPQPLSRFEPIALNMMNVNKRSQPLGNKKSQTNHPKIAKTLSKM